MRSGALLFSLDLSQGFKRALLHASSCIVACWRINWIQAEVIVK